MSQKLHKAIQAREPAVICRDAEIMRAKQEKTTRQGLNVISLDPAASAYCRPMLEAAHDATMTATNENSRAIS